MIDVLYFTASWCGPCRTFGPQLKRLASELNFKVIKVDVEEHGDMAEEFGVKSLPTTVWIKDGSEADRVVGTAQDHHIKELISKLM